MLLIKNWIQILSLMTCLFKLTSADVHPLSDQTFDQYSSCDENGTFTWLDSARKEWPSEPFEPFEVSTIDDDSRLPSVTSAHFTPNQANKTYIARSSILLRPTPTILRAIITPPPNLPPSSPLIAIKPSRSNLAVKPTVFLQQSSSMVTSPSPPLPSIILRPISSSSNDDNVSGFKTVFGDNFTSSIISASNFSSASLNEASKLPPSSSIVYSSISEPNLMMISKSIDGSQPQATVSLQDSGIISSATLTHPSSMTSSMNVSIPSNHGKGSDKTSNDSLNPLNHHGAPEANVSNQTKCNPHETKISQPEPDSGFLVRSVLHRDEIPVDFVNLTLILEGKLKKIFNLAYEKQLNKLGAKGDTIPKRGDANVKLWNIFWDNSTNDLHLVYQIEQNGHKLLGRDLRSILSHVNRSEMSNILGFNVSIKAEPYVNTIEEKRGSLAWQVKNLDSLAIVMIILSLVVLTFCSILTLIAWRRNRQIRRNTRTKMNQMNKFNASNSSTKESLVNWRKVSAPGSKRSFIGGGSGNGGGVTNESRHNGRSSSATIDSNHEFEYLSFDSPESSLKIRTAEHRKRNRLNRGESSNNQARLELNKEKVVPIGDIVDTDLSDGKPEPRVTYVTTKEKMINDYDNKPSDFDTTINSVPQLIQVQISEQTQSIIQAIRSELRKFNPTASLHGSTTSDA